MPCVNRNHRPPRHIGLIQLAAADDEARQALDYLYTDFQEALTAYAHITGASVPAMTKIDAHAPTDAPYVDTAIVGVYAHTAEKAETILASPFAAASISRRLVSEQRVYAICCIEEIEVNSQPLVQCCEERCEKHGFSWCGMLTVENARALFDYKGRPRLGFWRRPVSEALDRLIGAVRAGLPITESQRRAGTVIDAGNVITVHARQTFHKR